MTSASRVRNLQLGVLIVLAFVTVNGRAFGQSDDEPYLPGLVADYRDAKAHVVQRIDQQLTFNWRNDGSDARIAAGDFDVRWRGKLNIDARGDYRFFLAGTGDVDLKINDQAVFEKQQLNDRVCSSNPVALPAELVAIELSFRGSDKNARLAVLWSGPNFAREPIAPRSLWHERERTATEDFERGRLLVRALRCGHCHEGEPAPRPGPDLSGLSSNLSRNWLISYLSAHSEGKSNREAALQRMPRFGLSAQQAELIADALLTSQDSKPPSPAMERPELTQVKLRKQAPPPRSATRGERLFVTLGCLACHSWRDLGASGLFGGGDLTNIANKRPAQFFANWLSNPAQFNRDHLMPVYELSADERTSLGLFLAEQKAADVAVESKPKTTVERRIQGSKLMRDFRCDACHQLPEGVAARSRSLAPRLHQDSGWPRSCLNSADAAKHQPGYQLDKRDAEAVRVYFAERRQIASKVTGRILLAEHNCLACHAREGERPPLTPPVLSDKLATVARRFPNLAPLIPDFTPPALTSVGDKLRDQSLFDIITGKAPPHRPYLSVRMPRYSLPERELQILVRHLIDADRLPATDGVREPALEQGKRDRFALAGGRLVSSDGFGCTSCHAIGRVVPPAAPLNARGPNLTQPDRRIRRQWFERWVHNPGRIVPRIEMPAVQVPVPSVLDGRLNEQLAAVWHVLNIPGFEPPPPSPIRMLRQTGNDPAATPLIVTDLVQNGDQVRLKPFLIGLANRHNILIDLENASLERWSVGDVAYQQTKGKSWHWQQGGTPVLQTGLATADIALWAAERVLSVDRLGQFPTEADAWQYDGTRLTLQYRLRFNVADGKTKTVQVARRFGPLAPEATHAASGFEQEITVRSLSDPARLRLQVISDAAAKKAALAADGRTLRLDDRFSSRIILREPDAARFSADRAAILLAPNANGVVRVVLQYVTEIPVDRLAATSVVPMQILRSEPVEVAPGWVGTRLPLPTAIMPTGLAWTPAGTLVFTSLKGQVYEAHDSDGDRTEDQLTLLADGLPAPYGIHAGAGYVDVSAKYGLLRIHPKAQRVETVASGWGYTADYHDWAIGLPRSKQGDYFLGIPCQQDKRSAAAARFHGNILRLRPQAPTAEDPRRFTLEPVSAGHRFPTGLALNRDDELFVTDNQGNYNPFNELNHVRPGGHFGFINARDRGRPTPPLSPPAIDIPHPWTRSVNGICFLDSPRQLGRSVFGPMEGHLIGCEYDTRRLIRMTLEKVGDTFQGAAYPLSIPPTDMGRGFLGPVVCAVSPTGALYIGSLRDSGWGAGNNVGDIVRVELDAEKLPCGINEVKATRDGFTIDFVRPVDVVRAARLENYSIQSYRRESTPAYGGPDRDRRTEKIKEIVVGNDGRQVRLQMGALRAGFVYEFRLRNLAPRGALFHPDEAYYTLRAIPQ